MDYYFIDKHIYYQGELQPPRAIECHLKKEYEIKNSFE